MVDQTHLVKGIVNASAEVINRSTKKPMNGFTKTWFINDKKVTTGDHIFIKHVTTRKDGSFVIRIVAALGKFGSLTLKQTVMLKTSELRVPEKRGYR